MPSTSAEVTSHHTAKCILWLHAGPFSGVAHVATLLDHTPRRPLRHTLLRLLHSLMVPEAAVRGDDPAALAAARANAVAFMASGGIELLVDLLTCATSALHSGIAHQAG